MGAVPAAEGLSANSCAHADEVGPVELTQPASTLAKEVSLAPSSVTVAVEGLGIPEPTLISVGMVPLLAAVTVAVALPGPPKWSEVVPSLVALEKKCESA